jgi:hypothetical protein
VKALIILCHFNTLYYNGIIMSILTKGQHLDLSLLQINTIGSFPEDTADCVKNPS